MADSGPAGMRLRPMSLGDVLDEAFRLWRRHFLTFVIAMAVWVVPVTLFTVAGLGLIFGNPAWSTLGRARQPSTQQLLTLVFSLFAVFVPLTIVGTLGYLVNMGAVVRLASDAALGRPLRVGAAYVAALGKLGWLFLAMLAVGAVSMLIVTFIGIPLVVYLLVSWSACIPAIMLEAGSGAGLGRSWNLVSDHRWRALGVVFLMWLLELILVSLPSSVVNWVLTAALGAAAEPGGGAFVLLQAVTSLLSAVGQVLFGPLILIALTVLYYELRVRKEAFDLELRAGGADAAGQTQILPPGYYTR